MTRFPNGLLNVTGTQTGLQVLHLDLAGTATDDLGVAGGQGDRPGARQRPLRPGRTARWRRPSRCSTPPWRARGRPAPTWTLPVDLPTQGDYDVVAYAFDTAGQQDPSTTGATARYQVYPGDLPPTVTEDLLAPDRGHGLHRVPHLRQRPARGRPVSIAQRPGGHRATASGQYMSSTRHVHQHHRELADGVPEQPRLARVELLLHHAGHPGGRLHGAGAGRRPARPRHRSCPACAT